MSTLTVMCGLPASGKSTLAQRLALHGAVVLSADSIRTQGRSPVHVFDELAQQCALELARGQFVVLDVCALRAFERARWRDLGRRAGARVCLVLLCTPWRVCCERNAERAQPADVRWLEAAARLRQAVEQARHEGWDEIEMVGGQGGRAW